MFRITIYKPNGKEVLDETIVPDRGPLVRHDEPPPPSEQDEIPF